MKQVTYYGTIADAEAAGYHEAYTRYERGYMSRKTVIDETTSVFVSGDGRLFYCSPAFHTTQYILRHYFTL